MYEYVSVAIIHMLQLLKVVIKIVCINFLRVEIKAELFYPSNL